MEPSARAARRSRLSILRTGSATLLALLLTACGDKQPSAATNPEPELNPVLVATMGNSYPDGQLIGVLTLQDGCLALDGNATLWPAGTDWDRDNTTVVLADGTKFAVGENVEVGGGLVSPSVASNYSDTGQDPISNCVGSLGTSELALVSGF